MIVRIIVDGSDRDVNFYYKFKKNLIIMIRSS